METYHIGPLRVIVDCATGRIVAVQCRVTGCAAVLRYSHATIAHATREALAAHASLVGAD